jgi:hypothetical protein
MSEKVDVKGDVGQVVMGDVKAAARFNNVVTLNMGSEATPVQTITDFQRSRISELVKDLAALTGDHTLDIYRVIFTEFGIEKIRELPRDRYKETVALIDQWIVDATETTQPKAELLPQQPIATLHDACLLCKEKDASYTRLQKSSRAQWCALILCILVCGWLLYKLPNNDASSLDSANCIYEGKPYSIGSAIKVTSVITRECLVDPATNATFWGKVR